MDKRRYTDDELKMVEDFYELVRSELTTLGYSHAIRKDAHTAVIESVVADNLNRLRARIESKYSVTFQSLMQRKK